jgi:hypothetical protein
MLAALFTEVTFKAGDVVAIFAALTVTTLITKCMFTLFVACFVAYIAWFTVSVTLHFAYFARTTFTVGAVYNTMVYTYPSPMTILHM